LDEYGVARFRSGYGPALTLGLIALVLLLNFYLIGQRRALDPLRYDLIREMVARRSRQQVAMIDPDTQFFTRDALTKIVSSDVSRANRFGSDLTFVVIEADNYQKIRTSQNPLAADRLIVEMAKVVRQTFRGSDTVFRYSQSEFLVVMPDTSEIQATPALRRLLDNLENWNITTTEQFEMSVSFGVSSYRPGQPLDPALTAPELKKTPLMSLRSIPSASFTTAQSVAWN
ncbi:MAG TPA: GGDEF domain-containing protein, partial [Terriglobales bacterium]|nr:GGDEF domain-containing protein [Terriglobales bacterium]